MSNPRDTSVDDSLALPDNSTVADMTELSTGNESTALVPVGETALTTTDDETDADITRIKGAAQHIWEWETRDEIINRVTDEYLEYLDDLDFIPTYEDIAHDLLVQTINAIILVNEEIAAHDDKKVKKHAYRLPEALSFDQIAMIMARLEHISCISCAGESADRAYDLLGIYMEYGPDQGIYVTSEEEFYKIAIKLNRKLTTKEFAEVIQRLRIIVDRKTRCSDRDLIAVNNGIFNFQTKQLEPFDPDIVFMAKSHVNYNPWATNKVFTNPDGTTWDVESWMDDLSDDPEIVDVLWEILSAIIRPFVRWNKSAWLYSESGNNGKGTLCELMRALCGDSSYAAIPISDFSKDFALEPLTRSTAIIVDENDVGMFIDKAANLKAVITNDVIPINRKFKTPISYQFYGFMVQCLNEFPRIRDKSDSFYRRQLFIPFDKCFTGHERKYIKEQYIHDQDVLEYVLYRVLHMDFYTLSEPEACKNILEEYKEFNDPVRQFFEEMQDKFVWDLLPFAFLYELYKQWFRKNSPNGTVQGSRKFIQEIVQIANKSTTWYCTDSHKTLRVGNKMDKPEYLIAQYSVTDWYNRTYTGQDLDKLCSPSLQTYYRGLLRYNGNTPSDDDDVIDVTPSEGGDAND